MSFDPVYNEHSRALILGTWPSPKSREMAFYYGHPQNRFWPMLAALTGEQTPAREDIEAKKQIILRHGLAPVSYTHLDVYKRQDPWWTPWRAQPRRNRRSFSGRQSRTAAPAGCW